MLDFLKKIIGRKKTEETKQKQIAFSEIKNFIEDKKNGNEVKEKEVIDQIVKAILYLSNRKIGSLIAIEREVKFNAYVETGIPLDSKVSMEIITIQLSTQQTQDYTI